MGGWPAFLAAAVLALNPVSLAQIHTRMNDGLMASGLLAFSALILVWAVNRDRWATLTAGLVLVFTLNLKFTAVPILVFICAAASGLLWIRRGHKPALELGVWLAIFGIVGIFALGYAPYTKNIIGYGHPFYPLMGAGETADIMTTNTPPVLEGKGAAEAFLFSVFSETHAGFGEPARLKLPFALSAAEVRAAGGVDTRIAGFGPLFSGALLLAAFVALFLVRPFLANRMAGSILLLVGTSIVLVLIFPENWWARYVPFAWYVPAGVGLAALVVSSRSAVAGGSVLLITLLLNSAIVAGSGGWQAIQRHKAVEAQISRFASPDEAIILNPGAAVSRYLHFESRGVEVTVNDTLSKRDCAGAEAIIGYGPDLTGGLICRAGDNSKGFQ